MKLTVLCSRAVIGPDDDHMVGPINSLCGFASLYACFSYSSGTTMRLIPHAKRLYKYLSPAIFHRLRWAIGGSCFQDVLAAKRTRAYRSPEARCPPDKRVAASLEWLSVLPHGEIFASGQTPSKLAGRHPTLATYVHDDMDKRI